MSAQEDEISSAHEIIDWMGPAEDLCDELAQCRYTNDLGWDVIKHPLVISVMHHDAMNHRMNQQLNAKKGALQKAREEGHWSSFIWIHERPFRLDALLEIAADVTDAQWWELVASVWIDSENIRENPEPWNEILRSDRPMKYMIMDQEERLSLAKMPTTFTVWQGCTDMRDDGWSWTVNQTIAEWFAHRFADLEHASPVVRVATVNLDDVTAYFTGRNESEVLIDPEYITEWDEYVPQRATTYNSARPVLKLHNEHNDKE